MMRGATHEPSRGIYTFTAGPGPRRSTGPRAATHFSAGISTRDACLARTLLVRERPRARRARAVRGGGEHAPHKYF